MTVKRRVVLYIGGYDPVGTAWYRVFKRELVTFTRTWNVTSAVSDLMPGTENVSAQWTVTTHARNWRVETVYEALLWDDLVLVDFARPIMTRLAEAARALLDVVRSGALGRYFKANWPYGLFFLYPYFLLCAFAAAAVAIAHWLASSMVISDPLQLVLTAVLSIVVFFGLLHWPGRPWRLQQGLDVRIFSWDYVHGRRPDLDARLDRFAEILIARTNDAALDEIVIVGHSLGASLAVEVIARALARDPQLGRRGPAVCLLTVGSTMPQFTLHPAGGRFRDSIARIVQEDSINWAEYHARADAISFYRFDLVKMSRFRGDPIRGKPLLRRVRLHYMLKRPTFWRYRLRFMRLHYQFVMANERRANYDFFMLICGPTPFARSVLAVAGPLEFIASDGALIEPAA